MAVKALNIGSKKRGYWVALGFGKSESGERTIATAKGWTLSN